MRMAAAIIGLYLVSQASLYGGQESRAAAQHFLYVSDQRVVTVELIDASETILNFINLGDHFELLESSGLLILDSTGTAYRGHLFKREEADENGQTFQVNDLVEPHQFKGYSILGNFRLQGPPARVYFRLGARILALQPLTPEEFEETADRVGKLDLANKNTTLALYDAGFLEGVGELLRAGTPEGDPIAALLGETGLRAPVVVKNPAPRLLAKFSDLPDPVVVRIRLEVTPLGGMLKHAVEEGVDPELDQIALDVVRNSWVILPAVSEGKPVGTELVVAVQFQR